MNKIKQFKRIKINDDNMNNYDLFMMQFLSILFSPCLILTFGIIDLYKKFPRYKVRYIEVKE
jgi:hypothetical protein